MTETWNELIMQFQDLGGWITLLKLLIRILLASLLGAVFGFERELKNKPAGFITFMLVSMGSCLFAILQVNVKDPSSSTRIIAQVVSGIGFLGAGTILHNRGNVKGITTAALLWVSASVGLLVGTGGIMNCIIAVCATIIFFPLSLLSRKASRKLISTRQVHRVFVVFQEEYEKDMYEFLAMNGAVVKKSFFHNKKEIGELHFKEIYLYFSTSKKVSYQTIVDELSNFDWIQQIEEA